MQWKGKHRCIANTAGSLEENGLRTKLEIRSMEHGICPMSALEVRSRRGAIQIHVYIYLYLTVAKSTNSKLFYYCRVNFGDSAVKWRLYFISLLRLPIWPYFYFRSKFWRHHRVPQPRFPNTGKFRWFGHQIRVTLHIFHCASAIPVDISLLSI